MTTAIAALSCDQTAFPQSATPPNGFDLRGTHPQGIHNMTIMTMHHLRDRVERAIQDAPHLNRQHLRFEAKEGRVTLKGTVGSYFHKQMAQEAIRRVDGVDVISNELQVAWG